MKVMCCLAVSQVLAVLFLPCVVLAETVSDKAFCQAPSRAINFITGETSIRELDVSPDGTRLVFDVLGDIYTAPVEGGRATAITRGNSWDVRPVWSPDGRKIAFISDRNGSDQVFVIEIGKKDSVRTVGSRDKSGSIFNITAEGMIRELEWMPDGEALIADGAKIGLDEAPDSLSMWRARKPYPRYYGNGLDLYEFRLGRNDRGATSELEIWRLKKDQKEWVREAGSIAGDPKSLMISRNGKWLAFKRYSGAPDPNSAIDSQSASGAGQVLAENILLRDRASKGGGERTVYTSGNIPGISTTAGNVAPNDVANRSAFSPDSRFLFTAFDGAIHRIEMATGDIVKIPIEVAVDQCLEPIIHFQVPVTEEPLVVRSMRSMTLRPDGRQLAFSALRRIYTVDVPGGEPRAINVQTEGQFQPSYSPDGRWIAYASWSEVTGGHIWRVSATGGASRRLTGIAGYYQTPVWSPDGKSIAFIGSGDLHAARPGHQSASAHQGSLMLMSSDGGAVKELPVLAQMGHPPSFSSDGTRIRYAPSGTKESRLTQLEVYSVSISGDDVRNEGLGKRMRYQYTARAIPSPDGQMIAIIKHGNLYLMQCPIPIGSDKFSQSLCSERRITRNGANDAGWRHGSSQLEWSFANHHYSASTADLITDKAVHRNQSVGASGGAIPVEEIAVDLRVARVHATGSILLVGARIVTMRGNEMIREGAILIENGRISRVGSASEIVAPAGVQVLDVNGKTILPGFIDTHAHLDALPRDLLDGNHSDGLVHLAFGITTAKDPSNGGEHGYASAELIEAGVMVGPRLYGTEAWTNGNQHVESLNDAIAMAERTKKLGGTFLKYHSGWNAEQRRWIAEAARANGLNFAAHPPASNLSDRLNLTTISNGATSGEHEFRFSREHGDVVHFLAQSGAWLNVASAASQGRYYRRFWNQVESDPRIISFYKGATPLKAPWNKIDEDKHGLPPLLDGPENVVRTAADIVREGGNYTVGSHGDQKGIGFHWEMWAYVRGGMPVHDVLRAATINGAYSLGMQKDLGSIEVGKVADLLIFDKSPLEDIRNTLTLSRVMQRGVLRDSATLDEIWPVRQKLPEWKRSEAETQ